MVTASIVSHGHGEMVARLVEDLLACPEVSRIVITQNVAEDVVYPFNSDLEVRRNDALAATAQITTLRWQMQTRLLFVFSIRIFDFREIPSRHCSVLSVTSLGR
jgi:hypothetical protein